MPGLAASDQRFPWRTVGVVLALVVAYRGLLTSAIDALRLKPFSSLVFTPGQDTILVGLVAALWIARAERARRQKQRPGPGKATHAAEGSRNGAALVGFAFAAAILVWGRIVQSPELELASLAALLLGLASRSYGHEGIQSMILPAIVLGLAIPLPAPMESEWVWALQKATAAGVSVLLNAFGSDTLFEGVQVLGPGYRIAIADGSSGLRLFQILLPIALAIGHGTGLRGDRLAIYAFLSLLVGFALNVLRIVILVFSSNGASRDANLENSTIQALVLLGVAISLLVLMAKLVSSAWVDPSEPADLQASEPARVATGSRCIAVAGFLALVSLLAHSPLEARGGSPAPLEFPKQAAGWIGTDLPRDYAFPYSSPRTAVLSRSFTPTATIAGQPTGTVEVFVGYEARGIERIPSSKLPLPNSDWLLLNEFERREDLLDGSIRVTELARNDGTGFALVYSLRRHDAGIWLESLRALSGIDGVHWRDDPAPAAIRLAATLPSPLRSDRRRAASLLDRFTRALRAELDEL